MSAHKRLSDRRDGKIFIYIDNSNLWIQGQRTYAEKNGLKGSWDPNWRFDVGRLRDILLGHSGLMAEEKMFDVNVNLYGSTPPPVDTVWKAIESKDVKVIKFERSSWTRREKQVDAELIADSVDHASDAYHRQIPAVFIIVSGDRDVRSALAKITKKYCCQVHLWSWKNGLAGVYRHEDDEAIVRDLFQVHLLDDYLEIVGFRATKFRLDRSLISPYSIVVLDPLPKADKVEEFLNRLKTPFCRYEFSPKRAAASSPDLAIIPALAFYMEPSALHSLFMESKAKLEAKGLSVLPYQEYSQSYAKDSGAESSLTLSNRFGELPRDEDQGGDEDSENEAPEKKGKPENWERKKEEEHEQEQDKEKESPDSNESSGWTEVNTGFNKQRRRLKELEDKSRFRCHWRKHCPRGHDCKYGHTKEEDEQFRLYGTQRPKKYRLCRRDDCIRGSRCFDAHGMEELECPTCERNGAHEMHDCPERFGGYRKNYKN